MTFEQCPAELDVLFVPGGTGQTKAVLNQKALHFLTDRGAQAKYVTSVCTGALVLGAAGLLNGYRAGTHWSVRDLLPLVGATPVNERVVIDGNRITGGGITAGIDFGLTLLAKLVDEEAAQTSQLAMEYAPEPPFDAGLPEQAPPAVVERLTTMMAGPIGEITRALEDLRPRDTDRPIR
ncbi:DJ-1/PfpI family protein [Streptomyces lunaelactis]|uniref:DJ-1/PfpI family protein n=1 Tax=Streptomyces lunaelactis TaxID=1535768 RepID=UPI0015845B0C|nr:DJ-1/PfpI family protein [Streptomyces lunaelactis]NUK01377.1 DJ-1/PfpI family protein [Streptomyces lunaelactis]NUK15312.1 DJ-1/PfpI family protein [Streptomyces lunaelactis]NUK49958.1 DJ-1/PfpI family protein [Streptomyces lunaelactis]NUK64218.1 DJ-1/PfpI family protein [Streptomyces lunaelactis]NUK69628.1 DJ-1/PfpI family protein [Streptomyces lunaelactis]